MSEERWWHVVAVILVVLVIGGLVGLVMVLGIKFFFYAVGLFACEATNVPIGECWGGRDFWEFFQ